MAWKKYSWFHNLHADNIHFLISFLAGNKYSWFYNLYTVNIHSLWSTLLNYGYRYLAIQITKEKYFVLLKTRIMLFFGTVYDGFHCRTFLILCLSPCNESSAFANCKRISKPDAKINTNFVLKQLDFTKILWRKRIN